MRAGGVSLKPQLEFVPVSVEAFVARTPEMWRLVMLELNCDIDDASKKLVVGSVSASQVKTQETTQMWTTTLGELREFMEHRAQLLIGQPLTT